MKAAIIKGIARKFNLDMAFVASNIDEVGVPILADDCSVISSDQGLMMSALDLGEDKVCPTCGAYMERRR